MGKKKKKKTKEQKVKDMLLVIAQKQMPLPSKYDKVMIAVYIWSFSIIENVMPLFDLHWLYVSVLFVLAAIIFRTKQPDEFGLHRQKCSMFYGSQYCR